MKKMWKKVAAFTGISTLGVAGSAMAFSTPSSTDMLYSLYNMAVNDIAAGPAGFIAAGLLAVYGLYAFTNPRAGGFPVGVGSLLLAGAIPNISGIVETLGCLF